MLLFLLFFLACLCTCSQLPSKKINNWVPSEELGFNRHNLKFEEQVHANIWIAFEVDENESIFRVGIAVNSLGWVGFGPSATGSMIGSNMCVVREENVGTGDFKAFAYHASAMTTPTLHESQHCKLEHVNQANGETYAVFTRPLIGCKPNGIDIVKEFNQRFIAAYGDSQNFYYHGVDQRATSGTNPFYGPMPSYELPPDSLSFDIISAPVVIPHNVSDSYFCRILSVPSDRRYHVVMYEPLLHEEVSEKGIQYHHCSSYMCTQGIPTDWFDGEQRQCQLPDQEWRNPCSGGLFLRYSSGQGDFWFYPAGFAMGEGAFSALYMETHLYNPMLVPDVQEPGWGYRIHYTPTLLPVEGIVMGFFIGIFYPYGIPPGISDHVLTSECPQDCLTGIPPEGITIQAIAPHMHSIGRHTRLSIVRDGKELPYIHRQDWWDYNSQGIFEIHPSHNASKLLPGDRFILRHSWNSSNRTNTTNFGETFYDEMGIDWIYIYPKFTTGMDFCIEQPSRPNDYSGANETMGSCSGNPNWSLDAPIYLDEYTPFNDVSYCPNYT